ncbi:MAG TPA: toll/interleukin-1 receptor domain-containing protein [Thermoanaerobaculia bacterium]|nr:toll/interleukin-1 receptor domain-containing protein [Thermoanaerobaculia bacterium]
MPTAPTAASGASRHQIFISYSRQPSENAEFVRDLAGRLRVAGFTVWLDVEQIPPGADVQAAATRAIEESEIGLFVITSRWFEREWTQHEVRLFGEGNQSARRLVVLRETIDSRRLGRLGPYLSGLHRVIWLADEPQPDARFWEIYCGITGREPGPTDLRDQRGREVGCSPALSDPLTTESPVKKSLCIPLSCAGRPIACVTGESWTFLVTDLDEWVGVAPDGKLYPPLARLASYSTAALNAAGELLVGMYESMIARLRGTHWEYLPQEAPVLCFGACVAGDLVGTAAGGVVLLDATTTTAAALRIRDPVMALARCEDNLLVLGSRGMFGRASWPVSHETPLQWIETGDLGRPVGLFRAVEYGEAGVYSATRVGVLDPGTGRMAVCPRSFYEGIRNVVFLGAGSQPYAIVTDGGGLFLVEASLRTVRAVRMPRSTFVCGCASSGAHGAAMVWTNEGDLYAISSEGAVDKIAGEGVALAYAPHLTSPAVHVVRWNATQGASLELVSVP